MYLKKIIYVNWGNIPNTEIELGPINLLSGGNGSGKTTAADAIQTIMTAAHDNLFHFNPGQDESSQRGRGGKQVRTLASYVLGCDDGAYARPEGCYGYLAAVFYPTQGESSEPFTALLGMSASIETSGQQRVARLDELHFYILPDVILTLSDLLKEDKIGRFVQPLDKVYALFKKQFGAAQIEKYDKKKAYLCRLYGLLRGYDRDAVSEREAMGAARAFSRFMAYKPIKGIDEFVANEVLEPRDLGEAIKTVSAMLKRIHTMESDARQMREAIERLANGRNIADSFIGSWLEQQISIYSCAQKSYLESQSDYLKTKSKQQNLREQRTAIEQSIRLNDERKDAINGAVIEVSARRLGIPALRDKDQLAEEKARLEKDFKLTVPQLLTQDERLVANASVAQAVQSAAKHISLALIAPQVADKPALKLAKQIAESSPGIDFQSLLNRDWVDISPLEDQLDQAIALQKNHNQWCGLWFDHVLSDSLSNRDLLAQEKDRRQQSAERLQKLVEQKGRDIRLLESNQVVYPNFVRLAIDAINNQCPKADARVLCDYVEITDRAWQAAIEGYLGAARFGIIVAPEYEADAIKIVRSLAGQGKGARVIQGEKARRDVEKTSALTNNSIVEVMNFGHATAENYLTASYGNVERVSSAEALKNTRRGLTKDALGSGNYAMFRCDMPEGDLVFGQDARVRALDEKARELIALTTEWQASADAANELAQLLRSIDRLKPVHYADTLQTLLTYQRQLKAIDSKLEALDLSDSTELESELDNLKSQIQLLANEHQALQKSLVNTAAELKNCDDLCKHLNTLQEQTLVKVDGAEEGLRIIEKLWPDFHAEQRLIEADKNCEQYNLEYFEAVLATNQAELKSILHKLSQTVTQHNQYCKTTDGVMFEIDYRDELGHANFSAVCDMRRHFDKLYNRDKNHILAQRHAELASLKQSFNNAFVSNLCHSIYQAINDGKKILDELNLELENHRFGADRERFRFGYEWVPEFKEYWQFFKAVIDSPSEGEGESLFEMKLAPKYQQVRTKLMALLLDEDEQKALRDLARIADYRNYRKYEIYKEPEGKQPIALSQYGTGSGGQLETPAYIIRSAAITSAFRFNEGNSHLRMVLVDEAFSKMDEHRSREVINYLTESLGLQLLFIMPSSKTGPFMDLISNQLVFSKCPVSKPIGELNTKVLLDRQQCAPDKIRQLMDNHRRAIRQQASLDFMLEVEN